MTLIDTTDALAAFCHRQAQARYITVDTEFIRDKTYFPQLCLIQVAGPDGAAALDPLAPGMDLAPLFELMAASTVLKVFHAARQDIEIFVNMAGVVPARTVYEKLEARLAKSGRSSWLGEEMGTLTDPATYRQDPADAWRRFKVRSNNRKLLALVRELAAWRETAAQQRNLPRNRLLRDESLLEIAAHAPTTVADLARTRGLGKNFAEGKLGGEILAAVTRVLATPESQYPVPPPRHEPPPGLGPLVDLLRVLLKLRCEENDVAQQLVADTEDLEMIAADDAAPVRALQGWRGELFGKDALDLKRGRLALTASGKRIKLVRLGAAAEAAQ